MLAGSRLAIRTGLLGCLLTEGPRKPLVCNSILRHSVLKKVLQQERRCETGQSSIRKQSLGRLVVELVSQERRRCEISTFPARCPQSTLILQSHSTLDRDPHLLLPSQGASNSI